jgi:Zn-dependent protease/CBS domain-containing protein
MKWAWKLAVISGIRIQVHWTFLLIIVWVVFVHASQGAGTAQVVQGVVLVLAIFACVVLHELGHALTAKRFGIGTRDITLLPIGGVARLERMPEDPGQELLVALAGPAVNVVIAAAIGLVLAVTTGIRPMAELATVGGHLLTQLMWLNLLLVGFNLLPAFPMDGGRVLRALLAHRLEYVRATQIAATIGQMMAILFGFVGLMMNPFLLIIAIFVYLGAQQEASQTMMRVALAGVPVRDAMMTRYQTLDASATLQDAVDELLAGSQQDFPVMRGETVVGLLLRGDLVKALKEHGRDTPVADVMRRECETVDDIEMLERAFERMRSVSSGTLPVLQRGRLVGVLTLENVGEVMMINTAVSRPRARSSVDDIFRIR